MEKVNLLVTALLDTVHVKALYYGRMSQTAGARMTNRIPRVHPTHTMNDIQRLLHKHSRSFETINYLYVVDDEERLIGVLSIRELYHHEPTIRIGDVCVKENIISLHVDTHQERAAYLSLRHNLKAIPILDAEKKLLGVIPSDTLLKILYKETHDDLMRIAGVQRGGRDVTIDHILKISPWRSMLHRIPWLLFGLMGGLLAARIIGVFETTLEKNLILATFIPLIVYMGDAVGTQMEAFMIRDLALERSLKFGRYFMKQMTIILSMSLLFGLLLHGTALLYFHEEQLGLILGLSLFFAMASSVVTGLFVPFLFSRMKLDPANASGPIATIIQDIMSVTIYFTIASWFLG